MMGDIRTTCVRIKNKFKDSDCKMNNELDKLILFVGESDLFKGKKRKLKTLIRSFKETKK